MLCKPWRVHHRASSQSPLLALPPSEPYFPNSLFCKRSNRPHPISDSPGRLYSQVQAFQQVPRNQITGANTTSMEEPIQPEVIVTSRALSQSSQLGSSGVCSLWKYSVPAEDGAWVCSVQSWAPISIAWSDKTVKRYSILYFC